MHVRTRKNDEAHVALVVLAFPCVDVVTQWFDGIAEIEFVGDGDGDGDFRVAGTVGESQDGHCLSLTQDFDPRLAKRALGKRTNAQSRSYTVRASRR